MKGAGIGVAGFGVAGFGGGGGFGGAPEKEFFLGRGATEEELMYVHPSVSLIVDSEWGLCT